MRDRTIPETLGLPSPPSPIVTPPAPYQPPRQLTMPEAVDRLVFCRAYQLPTRIPSTQLHTQLPSNYPPNYLPTTHPTTHPTTFQLPTQLPSNYPPNYLPTTHPTTHCFSNVSCQIARGSPWVLCQSRHGFPRVPCQSRHGVPHVFLLQRIPLNFILCASRYLQVTLTQQGYEAQRIPSEAQRIGGPANFVPP